MEEFYYMFQENFNPTRIPRVFNATLFQENLHDIIR